MAQTPKVMNLRGMGLKPNQPWPGCVYIGRATRNGWRKSKWANQFKVGRDGTREVCIAKYRQWLCDTPKGQALLADIHELRGCNLLCWCARDPCHGDVLLELAN